MSAFREHVAGPMIGAAQLCARCGEVLWVRLPSTAGVRRDLPRWPEGIRVAGDSRTAGFEVTGWPYTPCGQWVPQVGDRPAPNRCICSGMQSEPDQIDERPDCPVHGTGRAGGEDA